MGPQSTEVETPPRLAGAKIGSDVGLLLAKLHATGSLLNNKALADYGLRERSFSVLTLACSGLEPTNVSSLISSASIPAKWSALSTTSNTAGW